MLLVADMKPILLVWEKKMFAGIFHANENTLSVINQASIRLLAGLIRALIGFLV